jgi:hypothetical protein
MHSTHVAFLLSTHSSLASFFSSSLSPFILSIDRPPAKMTWEATFHQRQGQHVLFANLHGGRFFPPQPLVEGSMWRLSLLPSAYFWKKIFMGVILTIPLDRSSYL